MLKAIELHKQVERGKELMGNLGVVFYRDTSLVPEDFFRNHLDGVGNTGGLEQVFICISLFMIANLVNVLEM